MTRHIFGPENDGLCGIATGLLAACEVMIYFYHTFEIWRLKDYANNIEETRSITINDILRHFILGERSCPLKLHFCHHQRLPFPLSQ
jgi:hypothetical protein